MRQNISLQKYFKTIQYLYQLKNTYFSGTTRNDLWKSNEMSKENIEDITKSDSSFPSTLVDHYIFPDVNFNGRCLINYISIHNKSNESIHFLHTNSIVKKFKHRLYIK